ncbi:MAG: hypothetical protein LBT00_00615 [Spirochaetaceae bacterium]|jgi:hypothetical protein|nr:hypothetical protein [Spirochaetaceae bacterium]
MAGNEEQYYADKCKPFQAVIGGLLQKEGAVLAASRNDPSNAASKLFGLSDEMLNLASYYFIFNSLALTILKNRNEEALNEARKTIYKAVIYLESNVTGRVSASYSEYEMHTKGLALVVDAQSRLNMVKKLGFAIDLLEEAYGNNSKWKWSFVELEGRFAAVSKNMLELSSLTASLDPRSDVYEATTKHLAIVKRLLADVSVQYRDRYNLSTQRIEDLQIAQSFLDALRYLSIMLGESAEADIIKKQYDIFEAKISTELKKQ